MMRLGRPFLNVWVEMARVLELICCSGMAVRVICMVDARFKQDFWLGLAREQLSSVVVHKLVLGGDQYPMCLLSYDAPKTGPRDPT